MATTAARTTAVPALGGVHRLSVEDVHRMVEAGVLDKADRIELVQGVLVDMVPIGPEHGGAVTWLIAHFARAGSDRWQVRAQCTFLLAGGYVLPDFMLVSPLPRTEYPRTALLVVEVAQTSQARDSDKASDYAAADVTEYWTLDLPARALAVHRRPLMGAYQEVFVLRDGDTVQAVAPDAPAVDVSELLG